MMEYVKPDYEVMVFEANEYVAACAWKDGTDLTVGCGEGYVDIKISGQSQGVIDSDAGIYKWTAGINGADSGSMLYPIYQKNDNFTNDGADHKSEFDFIGYGFGGDISGEGHPSNTSGEHIGVSQSSNTPPDAYFAASSWNDATGTFGWAVAYFHLLTYIRNKDLS